MPRENDGGTDMDDDDVDKNDGDGDNDDNDNFKLFSDFGGDMHCSSLM